MTDRVYNILRILLFSCLVVFGGLTLLQYLASPVHQAVLLSDAARSAVAGTCPDGGTLCLGWNALTPFIIQTLSWAQPFLWFAVWSAIVFGILLVRTFLRDGQWRIRIEMRPVWLVTAFIGFLWLHFAVIGASGSGDTAFSRIFEPLPQVYTTADAEQLQTLQESFDGLKERGCLTQLGTTQNGAGVYEVSGICMQGSFFTRVLPHVLFIAVLLLEFLTLGRFLLRRLRLDTRHPLTEMIFSTGAGACALIALLWLVAIIGYQMNQPIYSSTLGWGILILLPALLWRDARYWIESLWRRQWTYDAEWYGALLPLAWLLLSLLALNFLNVVRPFPIGWDDLGRYLNMPRLLVSYGFFIPQLASFQWEYLTSLGFLLFGYDSYFGATASMMINWSAGLLAVLAVYVFGRTMLGRGGGVLAALLYYALPLVGHFSFADMKVDNAVFLTGSLALFALFMALFPVREDEEDTEETEDAAGSPIDWRWLVVCGVMAGFAMAFKPTSIMTFFAIGTILYGVRVHWTAFIATISLTWALYTLEGRFNLADISQRVYGNPDALSRPVILGSLLVLGIGLAVYSAFIRPGAFKRTTAAAGVIIGTFFLTLAPWLVYNNIAYGNTVPGLLFTAPNELTPAIIAGKGEEPPASGPYRMLPPELQVDLTKCTNTSKVEELDRYWGYGSGWSHYLTLPWRTVMNADSAGYYVTTYPLLLLFPFLLLLPYFWRKREGRWLRWLFAGTLFLLLQWIFFANGILWYGIGTFLGLVIGLEALTKRSPDIPSRSAMWVLVVLSLMVGFAHRFWQYSEQKNLFEYPLGKITADAMRERTIPYYDDIREAVEARRDAMPDRPYVYRMGTFIPYFIPRNLEIIPVADQQLDFFKCLNQEGDAALTLKRLQALGFNSMIFDTNTATIERDPNGSLHEKVQMFVDFVNTPGLGLGIPVNDTAAGIAFILLPNPPAGSGAIVPTVQP
jgi:hypothetical protein